MVQVLHHALDEVRQRDQVAVDVGDVAVARGTDSQVARRRQAVAQVGLLDVLQVQASGIALHDRHHLVGTAVIGDDDLDQFLRVGLQADAGQATCQPLGPVVDGHDDGHLLGVGRRAAHGVGARHVIRIDAVIVARGRRLRHAQGLIQGLGGCRLLRKRLLEGAAWPHDVVVPGPEGVTGRHLERAQPQPRQMASDATPDDLGRWIGRRDRGPGHRLAPGVDLSHRRQAELPLDPLGQPIALGQGAGTVAHAAAPDQPLGGSWRHEVGVQIEHAFPDGRGRHPDACTHVQALDGLVAAQVCVEAPQGSRKPDRRQPGKQQEAAAAECHGPAEIGACVPRIGFAGAHASVTRARRRREAGAEAVQQDLEVFEVLGQDGRQRRQFADWQQHRISRHARPVPRRRSDPNAGMRTPVDEHQVRAHVVRELVALVLGLGRFFLVVVEVVAEWHEELASRPQAPGELLVFVAPFLEVLVVATHGHEAGARNAGVAAAEEPEGVRRPTQPVVRLELGQSPVLALPRDWIDMLVMRVRGTHPRQRLHALAAVQELSGINLAPVHEAPQSQHRHVLMHMVPSHQLGAELVGQQDVAVQEQQHVARCAPRTQIAGAGEAVAPVGLARQVEPESACELEEQLLVVVDGTAIVDHDHLEKRRWVGLTAQRGQRVAQQLGTFVPWDDHREAELGCGA